MPNAGLRAYQDFRIRLNLGEGRVFYVAERLKKGKNQYKIRIREQRGEARELFYFCSKTMTIRYKKDKRFVLSLEEGSLVRGKFMVVRPFRGKNDQRFYIKNGVIHNAKNNRLCADVWAWKDREYHGQICLWSCHKRTNQQFTPIYDNWKIPK